MIARWPKIGVLVKCGMRKVKCGVLVRNADAENYVTTPFPHFTKPVLLLLLLLLPLLVFSSYTKVDDKGVYASQNPSV